MCFKTAGLAPASKNEVTQFSTETTSVGLVVKAQDNPRRVRIHLGHADEADSQYAAPDDLRELAEYLNDLADKLAA